MLSSIDALAAAWSSAATLPSALIEQLTARALADNATDRTYTHIVADRSGIRALQLNAQCTADPPAAPRAPLLGVPVAVKDNIDLRGAPTSCGSRALARGAPPHDAAIVQRLERLGAVMLGKTNLDEAALGASGRNEHFGRCLNPRGTGLLSGGSSSGSAAAVAKGSVLLGIGTDTLGSVRIPAALCGVVGFIPSHGVISMEGVAPLYPAFDTVGLLAGSVRDIELAFGALGTGAAPARPATALPERPVPRILLLDDSLLADVDPAIASDYRHCCEVLRRSPQLHLSEFTAFDFLGVCRAALWEVSSDFAARIGFNDPVFAARRGLLGQDLQHLLERASTLPASKLRAGRVLLRGARQRMSACLADADALLTPTCPTAAIAAAADLPKGVSAFVVPANLAGLPAISWPQDLVPPRNVSLQLIGCFGSDLSLIELAAKLSRMLRRQI